MKLAIAIVMLALGGSARATLLNWTNAVNVTPHLNGDTIHFYGTNSTPFKFTNSNVKLIGMPNSKFESGCWPADTGAIDLNSQTNVEISWLYVHNTNCGTSLGTVLATTGITGRGYFSLIHDCIFTNFYRRTSLTNWTLTTDGGSIIKLTGHDLTISNCCLSDAQGLMTLTGDDPTNANFLVISNRFLNANHFAGVSLVEGCPITNVLFIGNYFDHADVWDGRPNNPGINPGGYHMDYGYSQDDNTHHYTNAWFDHYVVNGNTFGSNYMADLTSVTNLGYIYAGNGTYTNSNGSDDVIAHGATSIWALFFGGGWNQFRNVFWCNNVILSKTNEAWANGVDIAGTNVWVVNNGCYSVEGGPVSCGMAFGISGVYGYCYNNINFAGRGMTMTGLTYDSITVSSSCAARENYLTNGLAQMWSDHNVYPFSAGDNSFAYGLGNYIASGSVIGNPSFSTLSGWQTYNNNSCSFAAPIWNTAHADPNSVTNNVLFNAFSHIPALTDTTARLKGTNLTAIAELYGVPELKKDFNGNDRPTIGNITIGPLESPSAPASGSSFNVIEATTLRIGP
jgi:hypothetical protein